MFFSLLYVLNYKENLNFLKNKICLKEIFVFMFEVFFFLILVVKVKIMDLDYFFKIFFKKNFGCILFVCLV